MYSYAQIIHLCNATDLIFNETNDLLIKFLCANIWKMNSSGLFGEFVVAILDFQYGQQLLEYF